MTIESGYEFETLRMEISTRLQMLDNTVKYAYTASIAFLALVVTLIAFDQPPPLYLWPILFGLPIYVNLICTFLFRECVIQIGLNAGYLNTFYEKEIKSKFDGPSWEKASVELISDTDSFQNNMNIWKNRFHFIGALHYLSTAIFALSLAVLIMVYVSMSGTEVQILQIAKANIALDSQDILNNKLMLCLLYFFIIFIPFSKIVMQRPSKTADIAWFHTYTSWQEYARRKGVISQKECDDNIKNRTGIKVEYKRLNDDWGCSKYVWIKAPGKKRWYNRFYGLSVINLRGEKIKNIVGRIDGGPEKKLNKVFWWALINTSKMQ